ncbi:MAG: hypothetical protein H8D96_20825 [Desulfobacterales bacterium]|uniref:Uncharacterized protein n=1 Tax=Candidatus Desulfatibia vada TaxID=2841696 RepID=A0A8J6TUV3_9BACT|nr:hypothetical protein [Candidatus Desulfatibia vada]
MNNKKNNMDIIDAEYGVDSRYKSKKERELDGAALMEARLQRMKKLSKDQIIRAKLLQLKLQMEDYLKKPVYDKYNYFSEFVGTYVDIIYSKRSNFAKDIEITPVMLSQVINNHREPKDEFMLRLMIHSEMAYKNVCNFHKKTWYQVYFHEKICDTMSNQDTWRPEVEKHVTISEFINE